MQTLLSELHAADDGIMGLALMSPDGIVFAYSGQEMLDEDYVAAMGAALFGVGGNSIAYLLGGQVTNVCAIGDQGKVLVTPVAGLGILVAVIAAHAQESAILEKMAALKGPLAAQSNHSAMAA